MSIFSLASTYSRSNSFRYLGTASARQRRFTTPSEEKRGKSFPFFSRAQAGFTLIELLVSISILLIIVSTVVIRFISFDSTVVLKDLSYSVAFSVREAQSFSISVNRGTTGFNAAYGVSFTPGEAQYVLFEYTNTSNPNARPNYKASGSGIMVNDVEVFKLGRSYTITDVCVNTGNGTCESVNRLDVSFRRPEYTALFYADGFSGNQSAIQSAEVHIQSDGGTRYGKIEVGYAGQIVVTLVDN